MLMTDTVVFGWVPSPLGGMALLQQGFFDSMFNFLTVDTGGRKVFGGYTWASCGYIPASRESLVRTFLDKTESNWLLMLDWDITFTPDDVYALLDTAASDAPNKIVSGNYVTYMGDDQLLRPCWFEDRDGLEHSPVAGYTPGQLHPLTTCGMGFTIMHRDALVAIEKDNTGDPWPWYGHDVIGGNHVGEDLTFCRRARAVGVTIWGHAGVELGHTKAKTFHPRDIANPVLARSESLPATAAVTRLVRSPHRPAVLNVGGASKSIPIPARYADHQHILLDIAPGADVDIVADARDLPDLEPVEAVYCSHAIEHFHAHEVPQVLAGFHRVLKPGGTVEIHCPNLTEVMRRFVEEQLDLDSVLYEAPCGPIMVRDVLYGYGREIEQSGQSFYSHKTGFTASLLEKTLAATGFEAIEVTAEGLELMAVALKPGEKNE